MSLLRGFAVLAAACLFTACAGTPETSRTGAIHDVKIEQSLIPPTLTVRAGDEIRWVNHRSMPARLDFLSDSLDKLGCERGFSNFLGFRKETAWVKPNESVSLCFSQPGVVNYNIRMDSALPGGRQIESGVINIAGASGG